MSHFFTWVIIYRPPEQEDHIEKDVEALLSPYDETKEVALYPRECYCKGDTAKTEGRQAAEALLGFTVSGIREEYFSRPKEKQTGRAWATIVRKIDLLHEVADAFVEEHDLKDDFNPECEQCEGKGTYLTSYNPNSKWDWWVIGGRWDGVLQGAYRKDDKDGGFNFGDDHHQVMHNVVPASVLLGLSPKEFKERTPYALVTPDGEWHEKGHMGWWAITSNDMSSTEWEKQIKVFLTEHKTAHVVGCDLHI